MILLAGSITFYRLSKKLNKNKSVNTNKQSAVDCFVLCFLTHKTSYFEQRFETNVS